MQFILNTFSKLSSLLNQKILTLLIAVSFVIVSSAWYVSESYNKNLAKNLFENKASESTEQIIRRFAHYESALQSGVAYFEASSYVSQKEWSQFINSSHLLTSYPEIQGIGFVKMVPSKDLNAFEKQMRAKEIPFFTTKPKGHRDFYTPVVYLEPSNKRNIQAVGYDIFSEPLRKNAGERAIESGQTTMTNKIKLVQEIDSNTQPGILMISPLYRAGADISTLQGRKAAFVGFIDAAFRMNTLMQQVVPKNSVFGFTIRDAISSDDAGHLLYRSFAPSDYSSKYHLQKQIHFYGQTWYLDFYSTPEFDKSTHSSASLVVALAALIFYMLLILLIFSVLDAKNRSMNNTLFLKESQNAAEIGSYSLNIQTLQWESSEMLDKIFGIDKDYKRSLEGWSDLIHPNDREMMLNYFLTETSAQHNNFDKEYRIVRINDKETRWVHGLGKLEFDSSGNLLKMVGTIQDITQSHELLQTVIEQQRRYEQFLHLASDGIFILDEQGRLLEYNQEAQKLLGYSDDEMKELFVYDWDVAHTKEEALLHVSNTPSTPLSFETRHKRKDGSIYEASIKVVKINIGNKNYIYASVRDITESKNHERQLLYAANYDALTGLPNRILNADRLRQAMSQAQRRATDIAVLYLDLDNFKNINDKYGHSIGDKLLTTLAYHMKKTLREGDTLSRIGGDEFVAILTDINDHATAVSIIERLLEETSQTIYLDEAAVQLSVSIGVTFYPQDEDVDADQLTRQADQAMYLAKQLGKNRYHVFDPVHDRTVRKIYEDLEYIKQAFTNNEFVLYYQPKVNMQTNEIIGAEALIRWQHPQDGLIPPLQFLPITENHAISVEIGEWVIEEAITQIKKWQSEGLHLTVSVNVGARQLLQGNFMDRLEWILSHHKGFNPSQIEIEILETSILEDIEQAAQIIDRCKMIGINFALDDFGTGYSSLTYLKRLPVTTLKIDQSFVRNMLDDQDDMVILEGIIGLASAFNRNLIAEGVETKRHGDELLSLGCRLAQGYGIARPMPAEQFLQWSHEWNEKHQWVN